MQVEIVSATNNKTICVVDGLTASSTVADVKKGVSREKKDLYPERQALRAEPKGKSLNDDETLADLGMKNGGRLFLKDLGPQIGWSTVFLAEYAGPLVIYLYIYQRPWLFYGTGGSSAPISTTAHIAAACYTFHYAKRLFETVFVHRFSHATMPLSNLFKNCSYYWLFTAYVAYHVNHPLYTSPGSGQVFAGLVGFLLSEVGNLSIHVALRDLRPPGTKERKIPVATGNLFTLLFNFVSCPNYTYEFFSWLSFTVMTQCLPAGLFALAGLYQMSVWAIAKHKNYQKEFANYPKQRKAILPFLL
ncbi:probable very-long-chain enoyl-CoA reductase art-1 [Cimex lectularius]|uniref:very-long-chain enoyl-CoA reductase n=1 Tax=Cimex lectularius TaxID=79782 RepID=A0A8I6TD32_CIMLE|nr:probable very-long-chain enoyl-CoA reductase art-1 [Cimex lectularius]